MKVKFLFSWFLYRVGDFLSFFMSYRLTSWVYPLYNSCMWYSYVLDEDGKLWHSKRETQINDDAI